jgi:hypothetical protein
MSRKKREHEEFLARERESAQLREQQERERQAEQMRLADEQAMYEEAQRQRSQADDAFKKILFYCKKIGVKNFDTGSMALAIKELFPLTSRGRSVDDTYSALPPNAKSIMPMVELSTILEDADTYLIPDESPLHGAPVDPQISAIKKILENLK